MLPLLIGLLSPSWSTSAAQAADGLVGPGKANITAIAEVLARLYPQHLLHSESVQCEYSAKPPESILGAESGSRAAFLIDASTDAWARVIKVEIVDQRLPNAVAIEPDPELSTPPIIRISTALLERLPDEAALAFILAHEMSHLRSGKIPAQLDGILLSPRQIARIAETHQRWEEEADAEATRVIFAAGYANASGSDVLSQLRGFDVAAGALFRSHPKIDLRIEALARLRATTS